jgi:nicotinamidase-related amidase
MPLENAAHLCVDMQRIFAKGGVWETPWMERILPTVFEIVGHPNGTVFTGFITPASPEEAPGRWPISSAGGSQRAMRLAARSVVSSLERRSAPPAAIVDKPKPT